MTFNTICEVSPDGRSLLLQAVLRQRHRLRHHGLRHRHQSQESCAAGNHYRECPRRGLRRTCTTFQVVGNRLFALDINSGSVLAFNFDVAHSNFSQLAIYRLPSDYSTYNLAVSPDGALIYLPINNPDMITVLDANLSGRRPAATDHEYRHRNLAVSGCGQSR